jgi:hypothetical protein
LRERFSEGLLSIVIYIFLLFYICHPENHLGKLENHLRTLEAGNGTLEGGKGTLEARKGTLEVTEN